jgi:hypothetical protein
MIKSIIAVSLLAFAAMPAVAAPDIGGIQVGSTLAQTKTAIAKLNPSYRISNILDSDRKIVGVHAVYEKSGKILDQFQAIQEESGVVWFISRSQMPEKGTRLNPKTVTEALIKKYGEKYTHLSGDEPTYEYDRQGKLHKGLYPVGPCSVGSSTSMGGVMVPTTFSSTCGLHIKTTVATDSSDGMVYHYAVSVADVARVYDSLNKPKQAAESERKRQLDAEKARNLRPNL